MKIIVERNNDGRQTPIVTIDTKTCQYPNAIRDALVLALELDGHHPNTINEVFNTHPDSKCKPDVEPKPYVGS